MQENKKNVSLVILESPAKAATVNSYLGSGYKVIACKGHVRDLPVNYMGVSISNNFEPHYVVAPEKKADIKKLSDDAKKAEILSRMWGN